MSKKAVATLLSLFVMAGPSGATPPPAASDGADVARHVLNRLAFGPRPGEIERVRREGVSRWIEDQLHPEAIPDDEVARALSALPTLSMTSQEILERFERPAREIRRRLRREGRDAADPTGQTREKARQALREAIPPENRPRRVIEELQAQKLFRAAASQRQLQEVLVDFWMNHFNVDARKGLDRAFLTSFERDTIRPRIWGSFSDLLLSTATSPAMLFYLDNARSVAPGFSPPIRGSDHPARRASGLNENYARELMELHTLGVDGGYSQKDVTELARILTGWSIDRSGSFRYRAAAHDRGAKIFLGRAFPAGGAREEGETALRMLADSPATARHIAFELAQRFVADEPPGELVARAAARFRQTNGNLRETVAMIVRSPEFLDRANFGAKVKPPFALAASALRALGARPDPSELSPVIRRIAEMGEPLYQCQPPTGYSEVASAWLNTGLLAARLDFALEISRRLSGGAIAGGTPAAGLVVGSPDFQRM